MVKYIRAYYFISGVGDMNKHVKEGIRELLESKEVISNTPGEKTLPNSDWVPSSKKKKGTGLPWNGIAMEWNCHGTGLPCIRWNTHPPTPTLPTRCRRW